MTNAELNTALYKKLFAEQEEFRGWLLTLSRDEILKHSYEYVIREDILIVLENINLSDEQCKTLMALNNALETIFLKCDERDSTEYMEDMQDLIKCFADETI